MPPLCDSPRLGKHAIVIGGSIAGLCTARVLAEHFEQVTIFEQDTPPTPDMPRRHAGQAAHLHSLVCGGVLALEALFPGIGAEMERDGVPRIDFVEDMAVFLEGGWKPRYASDLMLLPQTRAALETRIYERVSRLANVSLRFGTKAGHEVWNADGNRVRGVLDPEGNIIWSDLAVHATGRGRRLTETLQVYGFPLPREERIDVDLGYATRQFADTGRSRFDFRAHFQATEAGPMLRGGYIFPTEGNRYTISMYGYQGHHPPRDPEGYAAFARSLPTPTLYDAMQTLTPVTDVSTWRFQYSRWLRLDRVKRHPERLIAVGDAVCSVDPKFGHGMAKAMQEALALGQVLRRRTRSGRGLRGLPAELYQATLPLIKGPWLIAAAENFALPGMTGDPPALAGQMGPYLRAILRAASRDQQVHQQLVRVLALIDPHTRLLAPNIVLRTLLGGRLSRGERYGGARVSQDDGGSRAVVEDPQSAPLVGARSSARLSPVPTAPY